MLAAVYYGPNDLRVQDAPMPTLSSNEVLVRVQSASICGTDLRILHGEHRKYPAGTVRIPGHEVVGVVAETGGGDTRTRVGQRVFIAPNMGCGHCRPCIAGDNNLCKNYDALGITLDGAFAEYIRVPAAAVAQGNIIPVADGVDSAVAALIEPFACVLRGQDALAIQPGEVVLVMGAGPIGIMHTKLARLRGARRVLVSEPLSERRAQAAQLGADRVIDPLNEDLAAMVSHETHGEGADVIIVAAPSGQAQESALHLAARRGRINFFGGLPTDRSTVTFDSNQVHYKELRVTGTTGCSTYDCVRAAEIVNAGRIELSDLVSLRLPLAQARAAFDAAADRKTLKVVLEP